MLTHRQTSHGSCQPPLKRESSSSGSSCLHGCQGLWFPRPERIQRQKPQRSRQPRVSAWRPTMLTRLLLPLLVPARIIRLGLHRQHKLRQTSYRIALVPQRFDQSFRPRNGDSLAAEEIAITKIQTSKTKFDLSPPALVELNSDGVSANVVKPMMRPRTRRHDAGITSLCNRMGSCLNIRLVPAYISVGPQREVWTWRTPS